MWAPFFVGPLAVSEGHLDDAGHCPDRASLGRGPERLDEWDAPLSVALASLGQEPVRLGVNRRGPEVLRAEA